MGSSPTPSALPAAVLLVAHGSRRPETARQVEDTATALAARTGSAPIRWAYLEINEPSIPEGLLGCIRAGAQRILVLPWFLNSGRHLVEHIPALVAAVQRQHPHVAIEILPHVGGHPGMIELLAKILREQEEKADPETGRQP
jgi:sirohydrochlorin cobaltochelatase